MLAALIGSVSVGLLVMFVVAPGVARRKAVAAVLGSCDGCEFTIGQVHFDILPFHIVAQQIHYRDNPAKFVVVTFDIAQLGARLALTPLARGRWEFSDVVAQTPVVSVLEKDPKPQTPPSPDTFPGSLPPLAISSITLNGGSFTYTHRTHAQDAAIALSGIHGSGEHFTSRPGMGSSPTTFDIGLRLEQSGAAQVRARFDLLAAQNDDHVDVAVQHLPLQEMDPFFFKDSGVKVQGALEDAKAAMRIRSGVLTGTLDAQYRGIGLEFSKTPDRGRISSFFNQEVEKIAIHPTREGQNEPRAAFDVKRGKDESVIKFLLDGLKPAAKNLMTAR